MDVIFALDGALPEVQLIYAIRQGNVVAIKKLASSGVDINWQDNHMQRSPLHFAAGGPSLRALEVLMSFHPTLEARDSNDMTPLMVACDTSEENALALVNAGADVNALRSGDDMTPLKFAVRSFSAEALKMLIAAGADVDGIVGDGFTPLMIAARHNNADAVSVLVENGADANVHCSLNWALGKTAEQIAELEQRRKAIGAFKKLRKSGAIT